MGGKSSSREGGSQSRLVASPCQGEGGSHQSSREMWMAARGPDLLGVVVAEVVVVVVRLDRQRSTLGQPQLRSLKVEGGERHPQWLAGNSCG